MGLHNEYVCFLYVFYGIHCFLIELCWGRAKVAYTKPQQRKKEESERLTGQRDQIKFIDLRFERWQVVGFRKAGRMKESASRPF